MSAAGKRVTIVDVAKEAGVSIGTVSRVLNSTVGPPETRRRVLDAVAALRYVPNHVARSLKRQATEQVALVVPDIANPTYVAMAKAVQETCKLHGYRLSLASTEAALGEEEFALQGLHQKRVDGLIVCSLTPTPRLIRLLEDVRDRVCVVGHVPDEVPLDNVRVDSAAGVELAVQHLLDGGRRTVAFINGTAGTVPAEARRRGFQRVLEDNHLPLLPDLIVSADFRMADGYRAIDELLSRNPDFDALFCANDVLALGALRRLRELDIRVPQDVAVVGMDNIELGEVSTPTLSSVTLLAERRGALAAEMLLDRLAKGADHEARKVTVRPLLIVRESSTDYVRRDGRP